MTTFDLPHPDSEPSDIRSRPLINGRNDVVWLKGLWIVPNELYSVSEEYQPVPNAERILAGETHVLILDGDVMPAFGEGDDYHFPARHQSGIYGPRRLVQQMLDALAEANPPRTSGAETRPEVLEERRQKLVRWEVALSTLIDALLGYTNQVRFWAVSAKATGNNQGAYDHARQLKVLVYRPFLGWFKRIINGLHHEDYDDIITVCNLIQIRHGLAQVLAPLSRALARAKRQHLAVATVMTADELSDQADTIMTARDLIAYLATDMKPEQTLKALDACAEALKNGSLAEAKKELQRALKDFDALSFSKPPP